MVAYEFCISSLLFCVYTNPSRFALFSVFSSFCFPFFFVHFVSRETLYRGTQGEISSPRSLAGSSLHQIAIATMKQQNFNVKKKLFLNILCSEKLYSFSIISLLCRANAFFAGPLENMCGIIS